ncbi:LacI family DNA-binding transcriptional regulator [Nonomuraea sp. NPDC003201]
MTIADVAKAAGVSPSTVSYTLSGKRRVSAETRRRVERCVIELGYHPNAGARALAGKRSHILAPAVPLRSDVYVPIMMEIATSVTVAARKHSYDVLLITNDEGPDGIRRLAAGGLADGVILMDVELDDKRIPTLGDLRTQAALIGLPDDPRGLSCVDHDFSAAGALCADHLADQGQWPTRSSAGSICPAALRSSTLTPAPSSTRPSPCTRPSEPSCRRPYPPGRSASRPGTTRGSRWPCTLPRPPTSPSGDAPAPWTPRPSACRTRSVRSASHR